MAKATKTVSRTKASEGGAGYKKVPIKDLNPKPDPSKLVSIKDLKPKPDPSKLVPIQDKNPKPDPSKLQPIKTVVKKPKSVKNPVYSTGAGSAAKTKTKR